MYVLEDVAFILHPDTGSRSLAAAISKAGGEMIGGHHDVDPQVLASCRAVVCTLRNPWLLMGSWYHRQTQANVPFDNWLRTIMLGDRNHEGPEGMCLYYGSLWATHYIRFERMQGTLNEITEDLGLSRLKLGHDGQTKHEKSYLSLYNHETSEIIRRAYSHQIQLGNYTF